MGEEGVTPPSRRWGRAEAQRWLYEQRRRDQLHWVAEFDHNDQWAEQNRARLRERAEAYLRQRQVSVWPLADGHWPSFVGEESLTVTLDGPLIDGLHDLSRPADPRVIALPPGLEAKLGLASPLPWWRRVLAKLGVRRGGQRSFSVAEPRQRCVALPHSLWWQWCQQHLELEWQVVAVTPSEELDGEDELATPIPATHWRALLRFLAVRGLTVSTTTGELVDISVHGVTITTHGEVDGVPVLVLCPLPLWRRVLAILLGVRTGGR